MQGIQHGSSPRQVQGTPAVYAPQSNNPPRMETQLGSPSRQPTNQTKIFFQYSPKPRGSQMTGCLDMTTGNADRVGNRQPATHASPAKKHCGASASTSRPVKVANASNVPASSTQPTGAIKRVNAVATSQSPATVAVTTSQGTTKRAPYTAAKAVDHGKNDSRTQIQTVQSSDAPKASTSTAPTPTKMATLKRPPPESRSPHGNGSTVKTKRIRSSADENNHLSCSVCFERFVSPKVLPCGHTFCLQCVKDIVGKGGPQLSPLCPICRVDVKLPESGKPEDLPTNFQVVSMLADNVSQKSQDDTQVKSARCAMHRKKYKLYCQTCAVPVCVECILKEHKIGTHLVIHEEDFIAEQMTLVDKSAKELAPLQKKFKATDERVSACKEAYAQQVKVVKQEIRNRCSEMQRKLTENTNKLITQVDDYEKKEDATFGKVQAVLERSRESLVGFDTEITSSRQKVADLGVSSNVDMNLTSEVIATILAGLKELDKVSAPITSKLELKFKPSETTEAVGSLYILKYT